MVNFLSHINFEDFKVKGRKKIVNGELFLPI